MLKPNAPTKVCAFLECGKDHTRRGPYCSTSCLFWNRVDKSGGPNSCWLWTGPVNPETHYGCVDGRTAGGKRTSAHRHAYRLKHGDPGRLMVLHKCDVRLCANPDHLFLGMNRDNWEDSVQKRRQHVVLPGEGNANAKLTEADVRAIRRSAASTAALARRYGVHTAMIRMVVRRDTWNHLADDAPEIIHFRGIMERPAPAMLRSA